MTSDHPPSYAEAKKMKSIRLHTYGCLGDSLGDCYSSSSSSSSIYPHLPPPPSSSFYSSFLHSFFFISSTSSISTLLSILSFRSRTLPLSAPSVLYSSSRYSTSPSFPTHALLSHLCSSLRIYIISPSLSPLRLANMPS